MDTKTTFGPVSAPAGEGQAVFSAMSLPVVDPRYTSYRLDPAGVDYFLPGDWNWTYTGGIGPWGPETFPDSPLSTGPGAPSTPPQPDAAHQIGLTLPLLLLGGAALFYLAT